MKLIALVMLCSLALESVQSASYSDMARGNRATINRLLKSLSCLPNSQIRKISYCRPLYYSYDSDLYSSQDQQGNCIYSPYTFTANFCVCVLSRVGAFTKSTQNIALIQSQIALIDSSSLSSDQKNDAVGSFISCFNSASVAPICLSYSDYDSYSSGELYDISAVSNNTKGIYCSFQALLQNGCSSTTGSTGTGVSLGMMPGTRMSNFTALN